MGKFSVALLPLFFGVGFAQFVWDYQPSFCLHPAEAGPCNSYEPSFYYNQNTGRCEFFVYSGCGGNENRFPRRETCEHICNAEIRGPPEKCTQDPEVGPCFALVRRYYFREETNKCEEFIYGGCGGNSNNFRTLKECKVICETEFS